MVLLAAVLRLDLETMERLLLLGADPSCRTSDSVGQRSPSHFIARYGYQSDNSDDKNKHNAGRAARCLALLSEYGADLEASDAAGRSPLHVAAAYGCYTALKFLLESAVDTEATDARGHTALNLAFQCGHTDCHTLLLSFTSTPLYNPIQKAIENEASTGSLASSISARKREAEKSKKKSQNDIPKSNSGRTLTFENNGEDDGVAGGRTRQGQREDRDRRRGGARGEEEGEYEQENRVRKGAAVEKLERPSKGLSPSPKHTETSGITTCHALETTYSHHIYK